MVAQESILMQAPRAQQRDLEARIAFVRGTGDAIETPHVAMLWQFDGPSPTHDAVANVIRTAPRLALVRAMRDADLRVVARGAHALRWSFGSDDSLRLAEVLLRDPHGAFRPVQSGAGPRGLANEMRVLIHRMSSHNLPSITCRRVARVLVISATHVAAGPRPASLREAAQGLFLAARDPDGLLMVLGVASDRRDPDLARLAMTSACEERATAPSQAMELLGFLSHGPDKEVAEHAIGLLARTRRCAASAREVDAAIVAETLRRLADPAEPRLEQPAWTMVCPVGRHLSVCDRTEPLVGRCAAAGNPEVIGALIDRLERELRTRPLREQQRVTAGSSPTPTARSSIHRGPLGGRPPRVDPQILFAIENLTTAIPHLDRTHAARLHDLLTSPDLGPPPDSLDGRAACALLDCIHDLVDAARLGRELAESAALDSWSHRDIDRVLLGTNHHDPSVRLAAYRTLLTRDLDAWPAGWLVLEARLDPDPEVRALGERLVR
ncbi:MAG: hypothetical protein H6838_15495 [Planctomycetes bacterium]|nr:hypothetical protein [Planctomycetota bacterium]